MKLTEQYTEIVGYWHQPETSEDMGRDIYNKIAQLEAENERLREALTEQISELRGYAYRGRCDGVPDDIRRAFIALGTPCDDIDKAALGGE